MRDFYYAIAGAVAFLGFVALCFPGFFIFFRDTIVILAIAYWGGCRLCEVKEFIHRVENPPSIHTENPDVPKLYAEGNRLKMNDEVKKHLKAAFNLMRKAANKNSDFYKKWKEYKDGNIPLSLLKIDEADKMILQDMILDKFTEDSNKYLMHLLKTSSKFETFSGSELDEDDTKLLQEIFLRGGLHVVRKPGKAGDVVYCNKVYHMVFSSFAPNIKVYKMSICQKYFRVPTRGEEDIASLDNKNKFF